MSVLLSLVCSVCLIRARNGKGGYLPVDRSGSFRFVLFASFRRSINQVREDGVAFASVLSMWIVQVVVR